MMNSPDSASEPLILLYGAPLGSFSLVRKCFPDYRVVPLILGFTSDRKKRAWRAMLSRGREIIIAVWEDQPIEAALALASQLNLPLHKIERGFFSRFNKGADCLRLLHVHKNRHIDLASILGNSSYQSELSRLRTVSADLLALLRRLKIFFVPQSIEKAGAGISQPERILILGSCSKVEDEQSLIRLAASENPNAIFSYQPIQRRLNLAIAKEMKLLPGGRILNSRDAWPEVEKAYTVDSPAGVGAIMAGLRLTVSGAPYYSGLGLTDDRSLVTNRHPLDAAEFFYLLCLHSNRYAASPRDAVRGCLAAVLSMCAERCQAILDQNKNRRSKIDGLLSSRMPEIFKRVQFGGNLKTSMRNVLSDLDPESGGDHVVLAAISGALKNLTSIEAATDILSEILSGQQLGRSRPIHLEQPERLWTMARKCFDKRHLKLSHSCCLHLLQGGRFKAEILWLIIEIFKLRFAFQEALALSLFAGRHFPRWRKGWFFLSASQQALLIGQTEDSLGLLAYSFLKYKRTSEIPFPGHENRLNDIYGQLPWQKAATSAKLAWQPRKKLNALKSLLYAEDFEDALRETAKHAEDANYTLIKAQILRLDGRYSQARELIEKLLRTSTRPDIYNEALLLSLNFDDDWSTRLWDEASIKKIEINAFTAWQTLNRLGRLQEAFSRHCQAPYFNQLKAYLRGKMHVGPLPTKMAAKQALVLSECFMGDELRFSRLYPAIAKTIPAERVVFSCDPRIYDLLRRSFPKLDFFPVAKSVSLSLIENFDDFKGLPGSDCCGYLDNDGWELAKKSDLVITTMHSLPSVLTAYESLDNLPELKCDRTKAAEIRTALKAKSFPGSLIAGLSWRSHLLRYDRNTGNFNLPQLAPLLEMEGIQWINCQYDGYTEAEQDYLDKNFPGRVINLENVDQHDNIEETAALYYALDVMVSGPTYCSDLAGSLGRKTLLFTKHPSIMAWARPGTNRHAFMPKVELFASGFSGGINQLPAKLLKNLSEMKPS